MGNIIKIKVKKIDELKLPEKANKDDAAYDVYATTEPKIVGKEIGGGIYEEIDYIEYGTNLFVAPQTTEKEFDIGGHTYLDINDWWLQGFPRSSISKYNLVMANVPVIDSPYRGEIKVRFRYLMQPSDLCLTPYISSGGEIDWRILGTKINMDKIYKRGDRILQVRPVKNVDIEWVLVDELDETDRGAGSFGSSGD